MISIKTLADSLKILKKEKEYVDSERKRSILGMRKCLAEMWETDMILEYEKYQKLIQQYQEFQKLHDTAVMSVWN